LQPEHLERFYTKMQKTQGKAAGTAHHVHRTVRAALGEAQRRGHITSNPAELAKAPRLEETEIEPYTVDEIKSLLLEAAKRENSARWVLALAVGLRQGEARPTAGRSSRPEVGGRSLGRGLHPHPKEPDSPEVRARLRW